MTSCFPSALSFAASKITRNMLKQMGIYMTEKNAPSHGAVYLDVAQNLLNANRCPGESGVSSTGSSLQGVRGLGLKGWVAAQEQNWDDIHDLALEDL